MDPIERLAQPSFMHVPINVRVGSLEVAPPDSSPRARALVPRIIVAYQRAMAAYRAPAPSMWDEIEKQSADFCAALARGDEETVFGNLSGLFQSPLVWGLGHVSDTVAKSEHDREHYLRMLTDVLVSLAEFTGHRGVTSIEQSVNGWTHALDVDLDDIVLTVSKQGAIIAAPKIAGAYGARFAGEFVTVDSVVHGALVLRLRQLGASSKSSIVEIGGGYGCQAFMALQAGLHYHLYDLPWVNAIQGYFLGLAAPDDAVSLFGEPEAPVRILPFWEFDSLRPRSVDFAVNINSLPEMGYETSRWYVQRLGMVVRGTFFSVNHEAQTIYPDVGPQQRVLTLVQHEGVLRLVSRHIAWMRQGYVEEVYSQPRGRIARWLARIANV